MKISLFIALRYFFSRKSRQAININSWISVIAFAVCTGSLIVVLSVFNGFDKVIQDLYSTYDPDISIKPISGKLFDPKTVLKDLENQKHVRAIAPVIEENALIRYGDMQTVALVRGISPSFFQVTQLDCMLTLGNPKYIFGKPFAIFGRGLSSKLALDYQGLEPVRLFVPDKNQSPAAISTSPDAFRQLDVYPSHEFAIQQEIDSRTLLIPDSMARALFQQTDLVSEILVKVTPEGHVKNMIENLKKNSALNNLNIQDRYEQKKLFNEVMKKEKLMSYIILSFILLIASFNLLATLMMIILEKKNDLQVLRIIGSPAYLIQKSFLLLGLFVAAIGTIVGIMIGSILVYIQEHYGIVGFGNVETMIIDSYPVAWKWQDAILSLLTGLGIGFINAIYPALQASRISMKVQP